MSRKERYASLPDWAKQIITEEIDRFFIDPPTYARAINLRPAPYEVMDTSGKYRSHVAIRHAVIRRMLARLDREIGKNKRNKSTRSLLSEWFDCSINTISRASIPGYATRRNGKRRLMKEETRRMAA